MVVPATQNREPKMKKYVGNNMSLKLVGGVKKKFLIVGNNSSVQIKDNVSSIKIVGDNCTLEVLGGDGSVVYVGNNGRIHLDPSIEEDVVTYVGKNGAVSSKNGSIRRHCSDSDVRKCGGSVKVVNLDGLCNVSVSSATTISLPNIQIYISGHQMRHST